MIANQTNLISEIIKLNDDLLYANTRKDAVDWMYNSSKLLDLALIFIRKGIKNHDGQKLLVQQILDNDKGLSHSSRAILEKLIEE